MIMLPWLHKPSDLEKRTLKIEVTFKGELILLRIIHIDKLYPVQYPMIALRIANNMIQNNLLMTRKTTIEQTEYLEKPGTKYIEVQRNLTKKLTKASSVATFDTQHTHQTHHFLKASGALEDHMTQQQEQEHSKVKQQSTPRDTSAQKTSS